ncbi:MAG: cysteine-rich CWC family protein [Chitinophagaceae bacterium]|nr:cysteine-rich CWC family protein [Chitinophagaceae bacterium]MDP1763557.1 cysteine-rich CWC family protein [Sediminibacterium sp.]MDP1811294.1 cysteine-rich CWC family protein [Sediminibacterium sp.]MDP3128029.1 cysteine-rich CWC family protein [Sediminibacterium sp.]MDP3665984.1 cysteine-rich CWC family protein [Sediminibacterium sp.]
MHKHEQKSCSRCSNIFECKVGDIAHCQCTSVTLSLKETAFIEERYPDCLCAGCLKDLQNKYTLFREKFLFNGR